MFDRIVRFYQPSRSKTFTGDESEEYLVIIVQEAILRPRTNRGCRIYIYIFLTRFNASEFAGTSYSRIDAITRERYATSDLILCRFRRSFLYTIPCSRKVEFARKTTTYSFSSILFRFSHGQIPIRNILDSKTRFLDTIVYKVRVPLGPRQLDLSRVRGVETSA